SRVLSWTVIPLGLGSPQGSSHLPADSASSVIVCLFDVAPGGGCRVSPLPDKVSYLTAVRDFVAALARYNESGKTRLCGPCRRLATPGCYPAPCSVEPGLSSGGVACQRLSGRLRCNFSAIAGAGLD